MIRLLHILAITVLIGSAGYAYSTKYETLYYAETLTKLKRKLQKEREGIAVAKAEWALLTRPDRLQKMVDRHLDLQPMTIAQLGRLADLPARPSRNDAIAAKLDALGLDPITTGSTKKASPGVPAKRDGIGALLEGLGAPAPAAPKKDARPATAKPHAAAAAR